MTSPDSPSGSTFTVPGRFFRWIGDGLLGGWSPFPSTLLVMTIVAVAQGVGLWLAIAKVSNEVLRYSVIGFLIPTLLVSFVLPVKLHTASDTGEMLRRLSGVLLSAAVVFDYASVFLAIGDRPRFGLPALSKAASLPVIWGLVRLRLSTYETPIQATLARQSLAFVRFVLGLVVFALSAWMVDLKTSGQERLAGQIALFWVPLVSTVQTFVALKPWSGAKKDGTGPALLLCAGSYWGLSWMNLEMIDVWWAAGVFGMIGSHIGSVAARGYTGRPE